MEGNATDPPQHCPKAPTLNSSSDINKVVFICSNLPVPATGRP
jgi:hypothetical protein